MKKIFLLVNILFIILMVPSVFAQGPVLVVVDTALEKSFHNQISLVGRTSAIIESKIVSEVSGRVARINASEGIKINKNQPLITIDSEKLKLSLDAKTAEAHQAKIQSELAKEQKIRAEELRARDLVSETTLDSAMAWSMIQESKYQQLEAERKQLEVDYENSTIKAPYSGYTGRKLVDVGEWVTPGMAVYEMVDLSKIKIIANLPEKHFGHLKVGSKVYINVANSDELNLVGKVSGLSPNASTETHTYPVIIEVDNSDGKLGGGMLVRVILSLDEIFQSLAVPKDAIIRQGNRTSIYTIEDGKAVLISVTIISTSGEYLAVQSDRLKAGMPVVIRGNERIFPGSQLTTGQESESNPADSTLEQ